MKKIKIIRALDYWCGIPLCFCLSIFHSLKRFTGFSRAVPSETKKIALVKLSELGALVLAYPLISRIRQKYPQVEIFFITLSESKTMLRLWEGGIREENIFVIRHTSVLTFLLTRVVTG